MVVYEDHAHCFGCGFTCPLSELGLSVSAPVRLPPIDLQGELDRIKDLPVASVRGLRLPVDSDSYYIVWPGDAYYKRRKFLPGDGPKYICPRGHKKPLYVPRLQPRAATLAVVEGELNALSIASLEPSFSVCSPGGVGDFKDTVLYNTIFSTFSRFLLILDKDQPGLDAAIKFKKLLLGHTPHIRIILMPRDANELLVAGELRKEAQSWEV